MQKLECKGVKQFGPSKSIYSPSKSGWSNVDLFRERLYHFKNIAKISKNDTVLLILHNHSSLISHSRFNYCEVHEIALLPIPSHISGKAQGPQSDNFYEVICLAPKNVSNSGLKAVRACNILEEEVTFVEVAVDTGRYCWCEKSCR